MESDDLNKNNSESLSSENTEDKSLLNEDVNSNIHDIKVNDKIERNLNLYDNVAVYDTGFDGSEFDDDDGNDVLEELNIILGKEDGTSRTKNDTLDNDFIEALIDGDETKILQIVSDKKSMIGEIKKEKFEKFENDEQIEEDDEEQDLEFENLFSEDEEEIYEDISKISEPEAHKKISVFEFANKNKPIFIIGGLFLVISIILGVTVAMKIQLDRFNETKGIVINKPVNSSNNSNYIFINEVTEISGRIVDIKKILMDSHGTIFYFNNKIDLDGLVMRLYDNNQKVYLQDITFTANDTMVDKVRFEALDQNAKYFIFVLADIETGMSRKVKFTITNYLDKMETVYFENPENIFIPNSEYSATLDKAIFASSGSTIYFTFKSNTPDTSLYVDSEKDNIGVTLSESGKFIIPIRDKALQYNISEDGILLGRMDFEAVQNLDSKIAIKFDNIYKKVDINKTFGTYNLYRNNSESQEVITIGDNDIVLERMGNQGDIYVLVFHTENNTIFGNSGINDERYINRVDTKMDVDLIFTDSKGTEFPVKGKVFSGYQGSDVVFDISKTKHLFDGNASATKFIVNSISLKKEPVTVNIDLKKGKNFVGVVEKGKQDFIIDSFGHRFDYMFGQIDKNKIYGFDKKVLNETLNYYKPLSNVEGYFFNTKIIMNSTVDNITYAIVSDSYEAVVNSEIQNETIFHKVVLEDKNGVYSIIEDEVIEPDF